MPNYFNDTPIETTADDRYGITPFAQSIAKSTLGIKRPVGTTIALHGPWGAGKSSAVNLIRSAIREAKDDRLVTTDFRCWWYRGEEALALAFLQSLHAVLKDGLGDKVKDLIPNITRRLLQAGPVVGPAVSLASGTALGSLISGVSKFALTFFPEGETVEQTFLTLSKVLEKENRRFLVIIDDIDRLSTEEALAVFRLIRSVGHLPNVIYLIVFDRELAEQAIKERYPSEGPHFLEKIVQAGFELPAPLQTELNEAVLSSFQEICGEPEEIQIRSIMNMFYDVVVPYIATPRHVARLANAISVTWPAIAGEIRLADFMALETLRLYEPALLKAIRQNKDDLCGVSERGDANQNDTSHFDRFVREVAADRHETAKLALKRLFPRLERMGYAGDWLRQWDAERRVCIGKHFDTYFRLSLSSEALSSSAIDELIRRADDRDFIQTALRKAAQTERKGGKSMVPVYLDELTAHAVRIEKTKVTPLLTALFEIHDEIDLDKDAEKGFGGLGNSSLQFHWFIRRLTERRFSLEERTEAYVAATDSAALGWLVDFVSSARDDYHEKEGQQPREEDCLVTREAIEPLTERALAAIRAAADNGTLLHHKDLMYILYRWRDMVGGSSEVRRWTDTLMDDENALVILARLMTGQSWSMGMGGFGSLGDRVSIASTTARISDDTEILDTKVFRARLERIRDNSADEGKLQIARTFLEAWDRKRRGEDR